MKNIMLIIAILSGTAFADYIPNKRDRMMKDGCKAFIGNYIDTYEADDDIFYLGLMYGALNMAKLSHHVYGTKVVNSEDTDIITYACEKTMHDEEVKNLGFTTMFYFKIFEITRK